jgi:hypothetical protein
MQVNFVYNQENIHVSQTVSVPRLGENIHLRTLPRMTFKVVNHMYNLGNDGEVVDVILCELTKKEKALFERDLKGSKT